ncbi:MAG: RlmE family RNA methyltransferase [Deltaproteobacteria bacterium]|nr:RlmE family RNA methyltransferase [Deltaproteobacteria bacterium]MBI2974805.1 RlmE family RNA methyltransferase [Deltaproteobacteria bacterium]
MYNRKDYYYKKAKDEGRASRASFKLEQIQSRYHIIKRGDVVLDLGAAPGSWMEVVSEIVGDKGFVVGVDLLPLKVKLKTNMQFFQGDLNQTEEILSHLHQTEEVDVVLSDMAPNTSGVAFKDAYLSYELCLKALEAAETLLKSGGNFIAKIFQGKEVDDFRRELRRHFSKIETYIPPATRVTSKEIYLIAIGYKKS